jgi:SAM-dependent methyltransferase
MKNLIDERLQMVKNHYDQAGSELLWPARQYRTILAHYYRLILPFDATVLEVGCGNGALLAQLPQMDITGVDLSEIQINAARQKVPHGTFFVQAGENLDIPRKFDYIILSDTINQAADVQALFAALIRHAHADTRLVLNFYSSLWRPILTLARLLGLRKKSPPNNWLASADIRNLLELSGWQVIKMQPRILMPIHFLGLGGLINRLLAPVIPFLCLSVFCFARPLPQANNVKDLSVSVIIPARNEAGNIEDAVLRTPPMGCRTELVFVEGHSRDNTWNEIQRIQSKYPDREITILQQSGEGKGNAVREGFRAATGDVLMILDADLTMPPEELPKYYQAIASGHAEFANGVRLVYPMQENAMRFINMCGNKMFSILFTWLLNQPVKDTLCGTKVLQKKNYQKIAANRGYFGEFDPFGDFDLLFGAGKLNLKFVDIPIRYHQRTYGDTNIRRWRHGWLLIRMVVFAARKLKFI